MTIYNIPAFFNCYTFPKKILKKATIPSKTNTVATPFTKRIISQNSKKRKFYPSTNISSSNQPDTLIQPPDKNNDPPVQSDTRKSIPDVPVHPVYRNTQSHPNNSG